jgi:hypothetical protein
VTTVTIASFRERLRAALSVMTPAHETDRAGALAWLAGRLHFEALLAELHTEADRTGSPATVEPEALRPAEAPARAA